MTMSSGGGGGEAAAGVDGQAELMAQLRTFLEGADKERGINLRMCSIALNLLKNLPGARDAVFEYYAGLFDQILFNYNPQAETQYNNSVEEETVVGDLQEVLSGFVETNPRSWAPMVSKWSLDTLGKLSYSYGMKMSVKRKGQDRGKAGDKGKDRSRNSSGSGTLHEMVTCWLGCVASRFLIEISAECLSKQIDENTEGCISALLETSVVHAPHFDWVVAHLGSCFPATLINRVLALGLKDFTSAPRDADGSISVSKVPKLVSVINILSHLGRNHHSVLQQSIHSLLISSLSDTSTSVDQQSTAPYILHLSGLSPPLCRALILGLLDLLTPQLIDRVMTLLPTWLNLYFPRENALLDLVAHILTSTDRGVPELLILLLEKGGGEVVSGGELSKGESGGSSKGYSEELSRGCRMLFNYFLSAVFQMVHGASRHKGDGIPVFQNLNLSISVFLDLLVSGNQFLSSSATQLLSLYALDKGRGVSVQILKFLLYRCETDAQLSILHSFLTRVEIFHVNILPDLVSQSLRNREGQMPRLLQNFVKLVTLEKAGKQEYRSSFSAGLRSNQALLAEKLLSPELAPAVLQIIKVVGLKRRLRVNVLHRICHCAVELYFHTLTTNQQDFPDPERERVLHLTEGLLYQLCTQRTGLQVVLRFLLEASINSPYALHLGTKETDNPANNNQRLKETAKLFRENFKFGSMPVQPIGSSTVFHAGVIGDGKRVEALANTVSEEQALVNRECVCGLMVRLCRTPSGPEEGSKRLALILVELISPDIMYNGIPWPEEEFIKVTIERDLSISRLVVNHPILWSLMELLALQKPALCYCSVIVRAVVSVCITHWQSTVSWKLEDHPAQMKLTRKVISLMGYGQFIPRQMAVLAQIIHILDPSQLHCILIDIWNYMRVNVPGPNIFQVCDKSGVLFRDFGPYEEYKPYCDRMRMVMVANLEKVAQIFKECYVDIVKSGSSATAPQVPQVNGGPATVEMVNLA